jgi:hypothetical protein
MNENSDRNTVIALLEKLGDQDDAMVLAAGRALHAKIDEMGIDWDQILVPEDDGAPQTEEAYDEDEFEDEDLDDDDEDLDEDKDLDDEDEDRDAEDVDRDDEDEDRDADADDTEVEDEDEDEDASDDDESEPVGDAAGDLKIIDDLLAAKGISKELRNELRGYKADIKADEFTASDSKYLEALQRRLSGGKKSKSRR